MKVYVDEMPTHISQRNIQCEDGKLCGIELLFNSNNIDMEEENCIQLISTHDQQIRADERKKVVEEIKQLLDNDKLLYIWKGESKYKSINEVLDQVEKGERNETNKN